MRLSIALFPYSLDSSAELLKRSNTAVYAEDIDLGTRSVSRIMLDPIRLNTDAALVAQHDTA